MLEAWRVVAVCPAYEVSSLGNVRRRLPGRRTKVGNILKQNSSVRYRTVTLVQDGIRKYLPVHQLVCTEFHGARPSPRHQAAHLNGDSHDNRADNLSWATKEENEAHKSSHGTLLFGERATGAKLTDRDVLAIKALHSDGLGFTEIGRQFGVYYTTIRRIVQGKTWKHLAQPSTSAHPCGGQQQK